MFQACTRKVSQHYIQTHCLRTAHLTSTKINPSSLSHKFLNSSSSSSPFQLPPSTTTSHVRNYWWMPKPSTPSSTTNTTTTNTTHTTTNTANTSISTTAAETSSVQTTSQQQSLSHTLHSASEPQLSVAGSETSTFIDASSHVERPEFVYPLTFGEPHEIILGGHVPESAPHINLIENMLEMLSNTGLPWWGAISVLTIGFRLAVLPLNISLIRNSARLNSVKVELQEQGAIMSNQESTQEEKLTAAQKFSQTLKENKCHPLYNIISPLVMSPMFLSVFLAVERICLHDPGCRGSGGMLWFLDLSSMDPTFMLPVLSAASWLLTIELGAAEARTEFMKSFRSVTRFAAAVMVPVTAALPSGVFVYWITSNLFSLVQIYVMQRYSVRRFFRIPERTSADKATSSKPVTM